ncbi:glutamate receptor 2.3-like isoform X3 [Juglans microcarpa x Juglans regia]|uniref:glutamate receptor 2.3-like isoform X3 n=1 Tax=Juglans microcarpa x Juglans regia TaxID=2249226 RepID=UPI001B7E29F6|nr:glutamate receptor 2.3-like isoform X3 [Juglans microcarpa x Juglans regia]
MIMSWNVPPRVAACYLFMFFIVLSERIIKVAKAQNTTLTQVDVGVVLDLDGRNGKVGMSCINMALSDFYASHTHYKTRLVLNPRDSRHEVVQAAVAALYLTKNTKVKAIIGPQNSMQANFVIDLGNKSQVPIISFSATSPSLTSLRSPYFFRIAQNDSSQVKAISAIIQAFGWREAVPIYIDNEYGEGIIPYFIDALQDIDVRVPYRSVISPLANDSEISRELYKLMTMQTRVFIVHMSHNLSSRVFTMAKEIGMMSEGYVWIITTGIANFVGSKERSVLASMQGVLGVKTYVPETKELESFTVRWKTKFQQDNPTITDVDLNVFGLWAYDAASALAMAVEKVGTTNLGVGKSTNASSNLIDLESFEISQDGPKLREAIQDTKFRGLAGEFNLLNGQLQSSTFQIINVNGNGERQVGFWTPEDGLRRELNSKNTSKYSTSKNNLGPIIWPGDLTSVPKGWEIPTNRKKLRIGVPVNYNGSSGFVKVIYDHSTNRTHVTGYCIDIFNAVMGSLPYSISYYFIPFAKPGGESAGTYDDLVYQVFLQKFDAAVGDITIIANRSKFVDFTLPFTESGVTMVVPLRDNRRKNAWVFLKPLSWDLWMSSGCFFVFIGFVVWLLEHRVNEDFRGPCSHQIGTSLWYAFSTMVFAHREIVINNCTRIVVIIWVFVVLILTQSYTASLASLLTVQQLQPTITEVKQLIKNGERVGYPRGSFVFGILKEMSFKESQFKQYNSIEECDELLSKGSANGGIAAAFDEIPYMKLFIGKYCSKYTMAASIYKTNGFGFVSIPRGSPLVADVSRAILNVTEGEKMKEIESAWLKKETNCEDSNAQVSSESLDLSSFWGLFLIAGIASLSALIFTVSMFFYKERQHIFKPFGAGDSILGRIHHILRTFLERDLRSHTFRKKASMSLQDKKEIGSLNGIGAGQASTSTRHLSNQSNCLTQTEIHSTSFEVSETLSREYGIIPNSNGQTSQVPAPTTSVEIIENPT